MSQPPKYRVYTIVERVGGGNFWLKLGNAVAHKDGKGFSMALQALPVSGALIVREVASDPDSPAIDTALHEDEPVMEMAA